MPISVSTSPGPRAIVAKHAACLWLAATVGFAAPAFAEDDHIALFKNVAGTMKIARKGQVIAAVPGSTLLTSDKVVSGADGSAGIVFKDGTRLTVGPSTEVEVRNYVFEPKVAKYEFAVYLARGTAVYSSGKIGKLAPESVKVDTPTATVGVRGTRFIIAAE
jgi:hypothetical protein